jgi:hypothetical protein
MYMHVKCKGRIMSNKSALKHVLKEKIVLDETEVRHL